MACRVTGSAHTEEFLVDAADGDGRPVTCVRRRGEPEPAGEDPGPVAVGDLVPVMVVSQGGADLDGGRVVLEGAGIALADPASDEVAARDRLEGLGGTLPGRIRSTIQHLEPLLSNPGVEVSYHGVPLYNALYRFDDQMLVTPYLYRLHGYQHPLLHLKRLGPAGIFESYAQQFEAIWTESQPILAPTG